MQTIAALSRRLVLSSLMMFVFFSLPEKGIVHRREDQHYPHAPPFPLGVEIKTKEHCPCQRFKEITKQLEWRVPRIIFSRPSLTSEFKWLREYYCIVFSLLLDERLDQLDMSNKHIGKGLWKRGLLEFDQESRRWGGPSGSLWYTLLFIRTWNLHLSLCVLLKIVSRFQAQEFLFHS